MSSWFGEKAWAPACEGPKVDTPVGQACSWCTVPIVEGDQGFLIPCVMSQTEWSMLPWHRECLLRSSVGGLPHLEGRCTCHGGEGDDSAFATGETMRAEALEVWKRFVPVERLL